MASGVTNRGRKNIAAVTFRGATPPTYFYVILATSAATPTVDSNTMAEFTEIAAGNGYTSGGYQINRNGTDWDTLTEDDSGDQAVLQLKDITWTAVTGNLPATGNGARWALLTDDNGTLNSREVWAWWDLVSDRSVSVGQPLTLQNCEIDLTLPAT